MLLIMNQHKQDWSLFEEVWKESHGNGGTKADEPSAETLSIEDLADKLIRDATTQTDQAIIDLRKEADAIRANLPVPKPLSKQQQTINFLDRIL
jgi:hypothetical protein